VPSRQARSARYFKEVDATEKTLRFWQEIHNEQSLLVGIHEKFPVDKGLHISKGTDLLLLLL